MPLPTRTRPVRLMHHDRARRPFIVIWEVTRACQLVCTHCRADAIRARNPFELTTDEGKRLLDDLASFGHRDHSSYSPVATPSSDPTCPSWSRTAPRSG